MADKCLDQRKHMKMLPLPPQKRRIVFLVALFIPYNLLSPCSIATNY
jgi:hypothetical protein